jgi:hypothetical protein
MLKKENNMIKTLQPSKDMFIQFTEDELLELNIQAGDKFTAIPKEDGVFLEKMAKIELDLEEFPEEIKNMLIVKSIEDQIPIDEVISNLLKDFLAENSIPQ